jgi:hypothetical protein
MTLAIVGSGSLARATCLALCAVDGLDQASVVVLARNARAAAALCHVAEVRAALGRRPLRFTPMLVDPTDATSLADALARATPAVLLVCASTQSPWEPDERPSAWTDLMRRAGLGLTVPFQAQVALAVVHAVGQACPDAMVVNACFPDAVNPLLAAVQAPVLTGVGNVGLIAATLQSALGLPDQSRLRVLAHHLHLHAPADAREEARAWLDGTPVADVAGYLTPQRSGDRRGLNGITGFLAAQLMTDLVTGTDRDTHLPGVAGRPGGYPVRICAGSVSLRLPAGVSEDQAVQANRHWAGLEGARVDDGGVHFGPVITEAVEGLVPAYAQGFDAADLAEVTATFHALRERLRAQPVAG